jgi:hypothetical protein
MITSKELSKLIAKAIGNTLPEVENNRECVYNVSFNLSGSADVRLGEDYEQIHNASIDWQGAFMFAVSKLNKASAETVLREFIANLELTPQIDIAPAIEKEHLNRIVSEIKGFAYKTMRGKFTVANESLSSVSVMSTCIKIK